MPQWGTSLKLPISITHAALRVACFPMFLLQGLAMNFDWYQERTKDEASTIGGWATALAYDFDMPGGYPAGIEVDWVSGGWGHTVFLAYFKAGIT
jgi:hypothetical protein